MANAGSKCFAKKKKAAEEYPAIGGTDGVRHCGVRFCCDGRPRNNHSTYSTYIVPGISLEVPTYQTTATNFEGPVRTLLTQGHIQQSEVRRRSLHSKYFERHGFCSY